MKHPKSNFAAIFPEEQTGKQKLKGNKRWQKKILILSESERWQWCKKIVEPKCGTNGLKSLLNEAFDLYEIEVKGLLKSYYRYSEDFVNSHIYCDAADAWSKNEHNKNVGIIRFLLLERYDLVQQFFSKPRLSERDLNELIHLIAFSVRSSDNGFTNHKSYYDFDCNLDSESICTLVKCANKFSLFKSKVSYEDIKSLFECSPSKKLIAQNNGLLAIFFNYLKSKNIIAPTWQSVISSRHLIYSSNEKDFLTQKNLSAALYQYSMKKGSKKVIMMFNILNSLKSRRNTDNME